MKRFVVHASLFAAAALFVGSVAAQPYGFAGVGTESSFALGFGYRATRHLGAELEHFRAKDERPAGKLGAGQSSTRTTGSGLAAVGFLPVSERVDLVGKVGAYRVRARDVGADKTSPQSSASEWTLGGAIGAQVAMARGWSTRAMVEQTGRAGEVDRVRRVSVQAVYSF